MHFRRPPRSGSIRRSQSDVPALDLRETLATKLAAIAQRGAQAEESVPMQLGDEEDSASSSDEEDDESSSGSSAASSPESSPVPSPTTTAAPTLAPTHFSSTLYTALGPAPTSTFLPSLKEEEEDDSDSEDEAPVATWTLSTSPTGAPATAEAVLSTGAPGPAITSGPDGARQSGDVLIMPDMPPPPPPSGISQTTEHVLIAAGSIGESSPLRNALPKLS